MVEQYRYPYLDSGVFIGWIKAEITPDGVNRGRIADHILELAERGVYRICVSSVTLAEVHKKKGLGPLDEKEDERIIDFFEHSYIDVVDVDREIGKQSNRFCRLYGLKPIDAIHLACALRAGCDVLLTWDDDFDSVQHDKIRVERPQLLGQGSLDTAVT